MRTWMLFSALSAVSASTVPSSLFLCVVIVSPHSLQTTIVAKFSFSFTAKASFSVDVIENESDEKKCMGVIDRESKTARACVQQLQSLKRPLEKVLSNSIDKREASADAAQSGANEV